MNTSISTKNLPKVEFFKSSIALNIKYSSDKIVKINTQMHVIKVFIKVIANIFKALVGTYWTQCEVVPKKTASLEFEYISLIITASPQTFTKPPKNKFYVKILLIEIGHSIVEQTRLSVLTWLYIFLIESILVLSVRV